MTEMDGRYRLTQDDSCHWYLIPADNEDAWHRWMGGDLATLGDTPEWAVRLDGYPGLVTFEKPEGGF